eukprot:321177-Amphidinium_carterae.1
MLRVTDSNRIDGIHTACRVCFEQIMIASSTSRFLRSSRQPCERALGCRVKGQLQSARVARTPAWDRPPPQ